MPTLSKYIQALQKEELKALCQSAGIPFAESSNVRDLRTLLYAFIKNNPESLQTTFTTLAPHSPMQLDEAPFFSDTKVMEEEGVSMPTVTVTPATKEQSDGSLTESNVLSLMQGFLQQQTDTLKSLFQQQDRREQQRETHQQVRNSGERFLSRASSLSKTWNGNDRNNLEPLHFLKSFDEFKEQYDPDWRTLLAGLRDGLQGKAKQWFLVHRNGLINFDDFKTKFTAAFLPEGYEVKVREQIRGEKQKSNESLLDFYTRLQLWNTYLTRKIQEDEITEYVTTHSLPKYRLQFNLLPTKEIDHLLRVAKAVEDAEESDQTHRRYQRPMVAAIESSNERLCLNCQTAGHNYKQCPLPLKIRCYYCNTPGKTVNSCGCRKKNTNSQGSVRAEPHIFNMDEVRSSIEQTTVRPVVSSITAGEVIDTVLAPGNE